MKKLLFALTAVILAGVPGVNSADSILICHKPGTSAEQTLEVDNNAAPGHLRHGDTLGACGIQPPPQCNSGDCLN
jgi:hypothetical protein